MKIIPTNFQGSGAERLAQERPAISLLLSENKVFNDAMGVIAARIGSEVPAHSVSELFKAPARQAVEKIRKMGVVYSDLSGETFDRSLEIFKNSISRFAPDAEMFSNAGDWLQDELSFQIYRNQGKVAFASVAPDGLESNEEDLAPLISLAGNLKKNLVEIRSVSALIELLKQRSKLGGRVAGKNKELLDENNRSIIAIFFENPAFPKKLISENSIRLTKSEGNEQRLDVDIKKATDESIKTYRKLQIDLMAHGNQYARKRAELCELGKNPSTVDYEVQDELGMCAVLNKVLFESGKAIPKEGLSARVRPMRSRDMGLS